MSDRSCQTMRASWSSGPCPSVSALPDQPALSKHNSPKTHSQMQRQYPRFLVFYVFFILPCVISVINPSSILESRKTKNRPARLLVPPPLSFPTHPHHLPENRSCFPFASLVYPANTRCKEIRSRARRKLTKLKSDYEYKHRG